MKPIYISLIVIGTLMAIAGLIVGLIFGLRPHNSKPPTGCNINSDCPSGKICQEGNCVSGDQPPPVVIPCQKNDDCPSGICKDGKCFTISPSCKTKDDCGNNQQCVNGICVSDHDPCDKKCPPNSFCDKNITSGKCLPCNQFDCTKIPDGLCICGGTDGCKNLGMPCKCSTTDGKDYPCVVGQSNSISAYKCGDTINSDPICTDDCPCGSGMYCHGAKISGLPDPFDSGYKVCLKNQCVGKQTPCGTSCCPEGTECVNNACCESANKCCVGDSCKCCNPGETCTTEGTCCSKSQACGTDTYSFCCSGITHCENGECVV